MMRLRTGVLLVNLGSPESTSTRDVRRYLREFLNDPKVIDLPGPLRWLLLNAVILPFRPRRSAALYRQIWMTAGSPLLVYGRALREAVSEELGDDYRVELAMRYGKPTIAGALERLAAADVARILVLPLYPQYSTATTGSSVAAIEAAAQARPEVAPIEQLPHFYADPHFIGAWAAVARPALDAFAPDYTLFSYHGLPESQIRAVHPEHCFASAACCESVGEHNRLCYRAHCVATTRALAEALELAPAAHGIAFQSRLGPSKWIGPSTDEQLSELARAGQRRLAVLCPAFVADCLETLEEIGSRAKQQWHDLGGEDLLLVPSLNAHPVWVSTVSDWIRTRA
ncbi:MAG: ferrochelatase [Deltaproteobacteria bacterium]|nr:ferrochelatase [Deltaproteobacteria bacterium]MBW2361897.1 ferrochelatase [Deltaproteobacteria bacterium]